jgi:hypothetical protein
MKTDKPYDTPPFEFFTADRYEVRKLLFAFHPLTLSYQFFCSQAPGATLSGLQISLKLSNICTYQDRIFVVVFGSKQTTSVDHASTKRSSAGGPGSFVALPNSYRWHELFRTEIQSITEKPAYTESYINDINIHFNALQCLVPETCRDIKIVIYRQVNDSTSKEPKKGEDLNLQMEVARTVLPRKLFESKSILKIKMKVKMKLPVDIAVPLIKDGEAVIGIVKLSSPQVQTHRLWWKKAIGMTPYCEILYSFGTTTGMTLSLEQLYASPYAMTTAQSLLSLWNQERYYYSQMMIQQLKEHFGSMSMIDPDQLRSSAAAGGSGLASFGSNESEDRIANGLEPYRPMLESIDDAIQESYQLSNLILESCDLCFNGEEVKNNVLPKDYGGHLLRRSVWKKITTWQYCTTNLNIHFLIDKYFTFHELLHDFEHGGNNAPSPSAASVNTGNHAAPSSSASDDTRFMHYTPTITMGCPCAHELKFNDGGLRKLFGDIGTLEMKLVWMFAIQHPIMDLLNSLIAGNSKESLSLFGSKVLSYAASASVLNTPDELSHIMKRKYEIARRIDICASQALGSALASIRTTLQLATIAGGNYFDVLARSLKIGFLVMYQSLLSTQGAELGMIEDLDMASLWLSLVSVRFVTYPSTSASSKRGESSKSIVTVFQGLTVMDESNDAVHVRKSRMGSDGRPIITGCSSGVTARRDQVSFYSIVSFPSLSLILPALCRRED